MAVGCHVKAVYTRARATGTEDVAVTSHDFWAPNVSDFNESWMSAIASAMSAFYGENDPALFSDKCTLQEMRFYDDYNGDRTPGDVDKVIAIGNAGSAAGVMLPPQIACSVTERGEQTPKRHWGRFYLPGIPGAWLDVDGTIHSTVQAGLVTKLGELYSAWTTSDYYPVVWSILSPGPPGATKVEIIQVDEILDVIRRRRYESVTRRLTATGF